MSILLWMLIHDLIHSRCSFPVYPHPVSISMPTIFMLYPLICPSYCHCGPLYLEELFSHPYIILVIVSAWFGLHFLKIGELTVLLISKSGYQLVSVPTNGWFSKYHPILVLSTSWHPQNSARQSASGKGCGRRTAVKSDWCMVCLPTKNRRGQSVCWCKIFIHIHIHVVKLYYWISS